jgi:hypothetical protein
MKLKIVYNDNRPAETFELVDGCDVRITWSSSSGAVHDEEGRVISCPEGASVKLQGWAPAPEPEPHDFELVTSSAAQFFTGCKTYEEAMEKGFTDLDPAAFAPTRLRTTRRQIPTPPKGGDS